MGAGDEERPRTRALSALLDGAIELDSRAPSPLSPLLVERAFTLFTFTRRETTVSREGEAFLVYQPLKFSPPR
mgnify:FL=1